MYPCECEKRPKVKVKLSDGKARNIKDIIVTTFWGPDGKPMSAAQFVEYLYGQVPELFKSEDELRALWSQPDTRQKLLDQLEEKGFGFEQFEEMKDIVEAKDSDVYDVLAYVAFAAPTVTRVERVDEHKGIIFSNYDYKQQEFIDFVLAQYVKEGVGELATEKLSDLLELRYHNVNDAVAELGAPVKIREVFVEFQKYLYMQV
ncbi:hypothetical protein BOW53_06160 [Solemya pervernicosa gill symbiont]|uniref:EcoEI R protein C-terminal domain-containing protein n=1 Tax=Solemya pervernicosa gill symbiont TaxID=642797 RepID=A0A1T2L733_9GAMM|nr:hypothetical protein BOW53_06160 [Solemya pervernicosa gill symbiont]